MAGFATVLALTTLLAAIAWTQLQRIGTIVTDINDSWVVSVVQLNELRSALAEMRQSEQRFVLTADPKVRDREGATRNAALARFRKATEPYEATGISGPPEQKPYDDFRVLLQASQATWPKVRDLGRDGQASRPQAVAYLLGESLAAFTAANKSLDVLVGFNVDGLNKQCALTVALRHQANLLSAGVLVGVIALGATLAWWLSRSIVVPLHKAIAYARLIANGDLSQPVESTGKDEAGQMLAAVADMQQRLRRTVADIQQSADQVSTASTQIASGNSDLAARTEQQASNLQQTASSIEQLSDTVVQGAESARQVNELAGSAADSAARGGAVVGEMVQTMIGISTSSRRIADIIGTLGGVGAALGKQAHLAGDDREAATLLAGARRFDRGVERQDVGLKCDAVG